MMNLNPVDKHFLAFGELSDDEGNLCTAKLKPGSDNFIAPWFRLEECFPEAGRPDIFVITKDGKDEFLMRVSLDDSKKFTCTSNGKIISRDIICFWTYAMDSMTLFMNGRLGEVWPSDNRAYPEKD